jgi:hypothetical protein
MVVGVNGIGLVVVVVAVVEERDGNGGSGCSERRSRFVNARDGEKVWKMRTDTASRCG